MSANLDAVLIGEFADGFGQSLIQCQARLRAMSANLDAVLIGEFADGFGQSLIQCQARLRAMSSNLDAGNHVNLGKGICLHTLAMQRPRHKKQT